MFSRRDITALEVFAAAPGARASGGVFGQLTPSRVQFRPTGDPRPAPRIIQRTNPSAPVTASLALCRSPNLNGGRHVNRI
jgi:hypothetical protein